MNQTSVLIIADDVDFSRDIVGHWQMERDVPAFTLVSSELWVSARSSQPVSHADLAILGDVNEGRMQVILQAFDALVLPVICVVDSPAARHSYNGHFQKALVLHKHEGWLESLVTLGGEVLRRMEAGARAQRADALVSSVQAQATLGRYMQETRHSFNNALTSVLGNAELLMMDPQSLPSNIREQLETIHSMSLRLHEMMQRFSSLEAEMTFAGREAQNPGNKNGQSKAYVSGS